MISTIMGNMDPSGGKRSQDRFLLGDWTVDPAAGTVTRGQESSRVEPKVMSVLEYLAAHAGEVVSKNQLLENVWPDSFVTEATLSRCISELRRILGDNAKNPRYVETIPKRGFRLIATASTAQPPVRAQEGTASSISWSSVLPWLLVSAVLVALALVLWLQRFAPAGDADRPTRVSIVLSEDEPLATARSMPLGVAQPSVAVSPDGGSVVYLAERDGASRLYVRHLDQEDALPIEGTSRAFFPFFSPDGEWLGFFADGALMKVSMSGGAPFLLTEATNPYGASWGVDGTILFASNEGTTLMRVSAEGGQAEEVAYGYMFWPDPLPGGDGVLVTSLEGGINPASYSIVRLDLVTGERTTLIRGGTNARYSPTGHLIYARAGSLFARTFDPTSIDDLGPETPIVAGVRTEAGAGAAQYAFSSDGTLVYVPGGDASESRLVWVDRQGRASSLGLEPQPFGAFRLSPDGERLAISVAGIRDQIWIYDLARKTHLQLTSGAHDRYPSWTLDGEWVTYTSTQATPNGIFVRPASGAGEALELLASGLRCFSGPWTSDGRFLVYTQVDPSTSSDIWVLPAGEGRQPRPLLQSTFNEWAPDVSPDGRWLAYVSDESGRYEVYVRSFPEGQPQERYQISSDGGEEPVWSTRGTELLYRNARRWMVAEIETTGGFSAGPPRLLFEGDYLNVPGSSFDLRPDGEHILALAEADPLPPRQINVILDWFAALASR